MDMDDSEIESVKSAIVDNCRRFWREHKKAYLLSRVGLDLRGVGQYIRSVTGKNLLGFVQTDLRDLLRIEQLRRAGNIWGLFPKDAVLTDDIDSYFEFPRPEPREGGPVPRYNPRFWAAFAKPLNPGERRFISLSDLSFEDLPEAVGGTLGRLEIDRTLIASPTEPNRDKVILENIQTWIRKFGLDETRFLMRSSAGLFQQKAETSQKDAEHADVPTELEHLIEAIGNHDLPRVQLPLDIVARLLKRRRI